jgi:DNA-binding transcriptional ArsR family regulator
MVEVEQSMGVYGQQTDVLKALAHPVRLQILDALRGAPECVCHLEALLGQRQAYISQQLARLREAGLVVDEKDGLNVFYRVADPRVFALLDHVRAVARIPTDELPPRASGHQPAPDCVCPKCQLVEAVPAP